jgi:hypothetical protein
MAKQLQGIGRNVQSELDGTTLILRIDLAADAPPSKSGKSLLVASTGGGANLGDVAGTKVNLSVYRPR